MKSFKLESDMFSAPVRAPRMPHAPGLLAGRGQGAAQQGGGQRINCLRELEVDF